MNPDPQILTLAKQTAASHEIDAALVCAIVEQESAWDQWAIRYEPAFRIRYVAPLRLPANEEIARSISWGLMQVMGQVAREHGFIGSMASLCLPVNGLEFGCRIFAAKFTAAGKDATQALQAWNGGADPLYAARVLARVGKYY